MQLIGRLYEPELAVLPIGDHFTMGPREAAVALEHARQPALRAVPLGHVPAADRDADALAALAPERDGRAARARRHGRALSRDVLDRRLRPRRRPVGRRDAVEVPRRRLGRPVGRAAGRRDRDAGLREPALRPGRARAAARRARRRGGRRAADCADDGREHRQLGVVDGRGRKRDLHRLGVPGLGRRRRRAVLRRAGEHPRLGGDGRRARADVRVDGRAAARRAAARRASPRPRPPAATAAASSRPRCSSSSATAATRGSPTRRRPARRRPPAARSRSCGGSTDRTTRSSARRRARSGSTSTTSLAARAPRAARAARLRRRDSSDALADWAGTENLEERVDGVERIDPVVLEELRRR